MRRFVSAFWFAVRSSLQNFRRNLGVSLAGVCTGGLAFYFGIVRKLTLPTVTLLAPIAPVAWIPLAIVAFGIGVFTSSGVTPSELAIAAPRVLTR